jgi:hypothetical protein
MDTERAKKILDDSGVEHSAFAQRLGIKANSFRMNLSMGRLSKKAVAMLLELEADFKEDEPSEASIVKEGIIRQTLEAPLERMGKVYMLPKNPYLRNVEFSDGSHGRFKAQPGKFGLGAVVKLVHEKGDMYRLVGNYDRKDRLVGGNGA